MTARRPHPVAGVAGVWRRAGGGRRLGLVGSIHGDERHGATVVAELLEPAHPAWAAAGDAHVVLAIGNPEAERLGIRQTPGGADLNRMFPASGVPAGDTPEHARAAQLARVFAGVDVLLDLHQTGCDTPPLAVVPDTPEHLAAVARLGLGVAVTRVEQVYGGAMLAEHVDRTGGLGLTVETGRKGTPEALAVARRVATRFLAADPAPTVERVRVYELHQALTCPGPQLRFVRPLGNTSAIRAGEVLATSAGGDLVAPFDGAVFLPRPHAVAGEPCLIVARDLGWRDVSWNDSTHL